MDILRQESLDMMYYDEEGVYFLTATGKTFYDQVNGAAVCGNIRNKKTKLRCLCVEK